MSDKNRTLVCAAISAMLDNPDASGIYPTTQCYDVLERLLDDKDAEIERFEAELAEWRRPCEDVETRIEEAASIARETWRPQMVVPANYARKLSAQLRGAQQENKRLTTMIDVLRLEPPATSALPEPCCGEYATCSKPCAPRGRWLAEREASPEQAALEPLLSRASVRCLKCGTHQEITFHYSHNNQAAPVVSVPREPPDSLLMSMAIWYDHGLGMPDYYDELFGPGKHEERLKSTLTTMRQLYEEVSGRGFYKPEHENNYATLAAASAASVTEEQITTIAEELSWDDSAIADIKRACRGVLALAGVRVTK